MSISKQTVVDMVEVTETGIVQVRTATRLLENNETIGQTFHRHTVVPGADYSGEDARVQAVCKAVHTPAVVKAYQASLSK